MASKGRTEEVGETIVDEDEKDFVGSKVEGKKEIPPGPPLRKGGEKEGFSKGGKAPDNAAITGDQIVSAMRNRGVKI